MDSFRKTRITLRYISGRPLDGIRRTDSTFFTAGTTAINIQGQPIALRASRWSLLPGWKRAAWRIGTPAGIIGTAVAYVMYPTTTIVAGSLITAGAASWGGYVAYRALRAWSHTCQVIRPLCAALAPAVDLPPRAIEAKLVVTDTEVRVPLPPHHAGRTEQVKDASRIVAQRIGGEWDAAINLRKAPFYLKFTPKPAPPSYVDLASVMDAIRAGSESKLVLGLGTRAETVHLDFKGEAPHVAFSIGTGGGKSALLRFLVAQWAFHGVAGFDICDVKQVSLQGMEEVPGLRIHRTVPEIADAIKAFRAEMDGRYEILLKNPSKEFPRKVLLIEEGNALAGMSKMLHREQGGKGYHPMFMDLAMILFMARAVNMTVVGVWQRMTADATGGGDLRDQFGNKLLARFGPQAWDALVGTRPRGVSSAVPGRVISVVGGLQRQVQVPFLTPEEALQLALSGTPVTVTPPTSQQDTAVVRRDVTPRFTLAEAAREEWCPISYANLRQRASRTKALPQREDKRYTRDEILTVVDFQSKDGVSA